MKITPALMLTLSLVLASHRALAQSPPGYTPDGQGGVHVNAPVSEDEWAELLEHLGGDFPGGFFSNKELCELLIDSQVGGWLAELGIGIIDVLAGLAGQCPSEDAINELLPDIIDTLKDKCEEQSGIYPATLDCAGYEIPALRVVQCEFVAPEIEPSCGGLRALCEQTGGFGEITPPTPGCPGHVVGYYSIPGCTCTTFYIQGEPNICEGPSGPVVGRLGDVGEPH